MKKTVLFSAVAVLLVGLCPAEAKDKHKHHDNDDRYEHRDYRHDYRDHHRSDYYSGRARTRTIYVIEGNRPVERVVYIGPDGRYYRSVNGRRVYVSGRYYTSYPTRYYYRDGRPRVGVSIHF